MRGETDNKNTKILGFSREKKKRLMIKPDNMKGGQGPLLKVGFPPRKRLSQRPPALKMSSPDRQGGQCHEERDS